MKYISFEIVLNIKVENLLDNRLIGGFYALKCLVGFDKS